MRFEKILSYYIVLLSIYFVTMTLIFKIYVMNFGREYLHIYIISLLAGILPCCTMLSYETLTDAPTLLRQRLTLSRLWFFNVILAGMTSLIQWEINHKDDDFFTSESYYKFSFFIFFMTLAYFLRLYSHRIENSFFTAKLFLLLRNKYFGYLCCACMAFFLYTIIPMIIRDFPGWYYY